MLGNGDTCNIVESSTKQYPTSLVVSPQIQYLKPDPCTISLRQFIIGVLTIDQMAVSAPFPLPMPWGGGRL